MHFFLIIHLPSVFIYCINNIVHLWSVETSKQGACWGGGGRCSRAPPTPSCAVPFSMFQADEQMSKMNGWDPTRRAVNGWDPASRRPVWVCIWRPGQVWLTETSHPWKTVFKGNIQISLCHSLLRLMLVLVFYLVLLLLIKCTILFGKEAFILYVLVCHWSNPGSTVPV